MTTHLSPLPSEPYMAQFPPTVDWTLGWRYRRVKTPNGKFEMQRIPLTPHEMLHPKEGYVIPESTTHTNIVADLGNMLRSWRLKHAGMTIFHDLVFKWDRPEIGTYAPDLAIVPNVHSPNKDRGTFDVAKEKTRPCLIIEVVSAKTRKADREDKLRDYALLGIQEYLYIDSRTEDKELVGEVVGHRLYGHSYKRLPTGEEGGVYCETVGLRIGIRGNKTWIKDMTAGRRLLTHQETVQALTVANERIATLEEELVLTRAHAATEAEAHRRSEQRIAALEVQVKLFQGQKMQE